MQLERPTDTVDMFNRFGSGYTLMIKVAGAASINPQPVNGFLLPPPEYSPAQVPMVFANPVATDLPAVNEPGGSSTAARYIG